MGVTATLENPRIIGDNTYEVGLRRRNLLTRIVVAMAVASVKATLVGTWFMHLIHETKFNILLFLSSIWFIGAFFLFTSIDLMSRDRVMKNSGTFEFRQDRADSADQSTLSTTTKP